MRKKKEVKYDYKKISNILSLIIIGLFLGLIGLFLNFLVITENNCKMPVYLGNLDSKYSETHFSYYYFKQVSYPYLSDIIFIKLPYQDYRVKYSIGDVLIYSSLWLLFFVAFILIKTKWFVIIRKEL